MNDNDANELYALLRSTSNDIDRIKSLIVEHKNSFDDDIADDDEYHNDYSSWSLQLERLLHGATMSYNYYSSELQKIAMPPGSE